MLQIKAFLAFLMTLAWISQSSAGIVYNEGTSGDLSANGSVVFNLPVGVSTFAGTIQTGDDDAFLASPGSFVFTTTILNTGTASLRYNSSIAGFFGLLAAGESASFGDRGEDTLLTVDYDRQSQDLASWLYTLTTRDPSAPVPAPATLALFSLGLAGLGWSRRRV